MHRAVFRVDESDLCGSGHLTRCYALAHRLKAKGWQIVFLVRQINDRSLMRLSDLGVRVVIVGSEEEFMDYLISNDVAIVDKYDFPRSLWDVLGQRKDIITVCIDDARQCFYSADLVVLPNEGVRREDINISRSSSLLLGQKYLLLRPEIFSASRNAHGIGERREILIAHGGSRSICWVKHILKLANRTDLENTIINILSGYEMQVEDLGGRWDSLNICIHKAADEEHMARLYSNALFAVVPCSTMLIEAMMYGCPTITGWLEENQRISLETLSANGLCKSIGKLECANANDFRNSVKNLMGESTGMLARQAAFAKDVRHGSARIEKALSRLVAIHASSKEEAKQNA